jgi:WD40 repeat protein
VQTSAFSPGGSILASLTESLDDGDVEVTLYSIWHMEALKRFSLSDYCMRRHDNFFAYSPDGTTLIKDFNDTGFLIVQRSSRDDLFSPRGDLLIAKVQPDTPTNSTSWAAAFDPSSEFLASAGWDQNFRLIAVASLRDRVLGLQTARRERCE